MDTEDNENEGDDESSSHLVPLLYSSEEENDDTKSEGCYYQIFVV
jgi:hypothetical protein